MFLKYFYSSAAIMSKCLIFQYGYSVPVCVVLLHRKFQLCLTMEQSKRWKILFPHLILIY